MTRTSRSYEYNPEKAKALLAEAGYPNGLKLKYDTFQYGTGELVQSWIQRDLKKIGVDVEHPEVRMDRLPAPLGLGHDRGHRHGRHRLGHDHPVLRRHRRALRLGAAGRRQFGLVLQPEVDKLLDAAVAEPDEAKAREIYQKANKLIMEDAAFVPVVDDMQPMITAPSVKGFVNPPNDWFDFSTVWIEG